MSRGPKTGSQRSTSAKHLRGNARKKRFKNNDTEAQARYHAAIAHRRAKKLKRK